MLDWLTTGALVGLVAGAVWFDLRENRIPNVVTVSGLAAGLTLRIPLGLASVGSGLAGALIGLLVALPFFLVGGLGGGDTKLLVAVGAFLGLGRILDGLLMMAVAGGVLALVTVLRKGAISQVAANIRTIFLTLGRRTFTGWKGEASEAPVTLDSPGALSVPYGVAIAAGALYGWFA